MQCTIQHYKACLRKNFYLSSLSAFGKLHIFLFAKAMYLFWKILSKTPKYICKCYVSERREIL